MKNSVQILLLAALAVVPSLAADMSVHPPFKPDFHPMAKANPDFRPFSSGIIPATDASKLRKRQRTCPTSDGYLCVNTGKCCPVGYTCVGDSVNAGCCPNGKVCDTSISYCAPGQTDCTSIIGVSGCCPTATHKCAISGGTPGCAKLTSSGGDSSGGGGSSGGSSGSSTDQCDTGHYLCADGVGCCPNGSTCIPLTKLCQKPCKAEYTLCSFGGCCEPGYSCDASTQLCRKGSSSGTGSLSLPPIPFSSTRPESTVQSSVADPFTTISIRSSSPVSTSTINAPLTTTQPAVITPDSPNKNGGTSTTSFVPVVTGPGSLTTAPASRLKPGWLGGLGIVFFSVFFHL
ncbi:hypothetical protein L873DRAFT_1691769 [Choiromyces venosus 120613-1]|uniref:Granulins domain-containing protein n=1 Tax=Choiromyces venosus 120613-1 TaxID=1336337 RepID=A0A3N4JK94_9PEZI|nr:hypothetical protein L873DRAFT_1691769 [Choiromyces venosus 120613-1]